MKTTLKRGGKYFVFIPSVPGESDVTKTAAKISADLEEALNITALSTLVIPGMASVQFIEAVDEQPGRAAAKEITAQCSYVGKSGHRCGRRTRSVNGLCPFHQHHNKKEADLGFDLTDDNKGCPRCGRDKSRAGGLCSECLSKAQTTRVE